MSHTERHCWFCPDSTDRDTEHHPCTAYGIGFGVQTGNLCPKCEATYTPEEHDTDCAGTTVPPRALVKLRNRLYPNNELVLDLDDLREIYGELCKEIEQLTRDLAEARMYQQNAEYSEGCALADVRMWRELAAKAERGRETTSLLKEIEKSQKPRRGSKPT